MYTSITNRGVSIKNKMIENYYILNQIVQGIDTGIVIIYEKKLLHINNEMRRITRRTYKSMEFDLMSIVCPPFRHSVLKAYVSVLKEYSDKKEIYFDIILPDGSLKSVKCRITRIKIFEKNGIFATVHEEFSEIKRDFIEPLTIKLWRKYRADYEHILNSFYDFVIFIDNDYKIKNISKKVEKILGYTRQEFLGEKINSVCNVEPMEDFLEVLSGFQRTDYTGRNRVVKNFQLTLTTKDNIPVKFAVSAFTIKVLNYIKGYSLVFTSIKNLDKSKLSADEIAANIAHEFRSPLNAIIGFSNIVSNENLSIYERNMYLKYIKQSCNSLLSVVNDFSDFNKLNHNKIIIHRDDFNINSLFEQLGAYCLMYKKDYNKNDIQIISSLQYPDEEVIINTDEQRVFQIMINLLNNAFKYTEKGFIKYQYIIDNNFLVLKVSDSGIGIPKENLTKIFNRLTQLDVNNYNNGSGLGLAISKNLVELMGGVISVNSEIGIGTEFLIKLPIGRSEEKKTTDKEKEDLEFDFSDKKIIVAEDAQINFILIDKILEKTGVNILWAKNGKECVDLFMENRDVALILMDVQMPVMDGFEAIKRILQIEPNLPIIAQTAFSYPEERRRILSIGCVDFVSKPIDRALLIQKMDKAFNLNKQEI